MKRLTNLLTTTVLCLFVLAAPGWALDQAQLTALKAAIQAEPANLTRSDAQITAWANSTATPTYWVWKTRLARAEAVQQTSVDGTTFNWTGAGYITRSVGERDAWRELWNHEGACNPSLLNVRQAFADIFSGATAPAPANRAHLLAISRRAATVAEKALATGNGTTATPSMLTFEGDVREQDIIDALSRG